MVAGSRKKYWWICPRGHSCKAAIAHRSAGSGCPYCAGNKVLPGFNDLITTHPDIESQWDYDRNEADPTEVSAGSRRKAYFRCPKGHTHETIIVNFLRRRNCLYCTNRRILSGFNDLATLHPKIATEWHPWKNHPDTADAVLPGNKKRWWRCPAGHEQHGTVPNRIKTRGCTKCPPELRAGAATPGTAS